MSKTIDETNTIMQHISDEKKKIITQINYYSEEQLNMLQQISSENAILKQKIIELSYNNVELTNEIKKINNELKSDINYLTTTFITIFVVSGVMHGLYLLT